MWRPICTAVAALLIGCAPATAQQSIAITHVTVIGGSAPKPAADQTVLISGDRISAVGKADKVPIPAGARTVDGSGKFLIPGLWDMHVHGTGIPHFSELYIANGVTGIRDMFGPTIRYALSTRDAITSGKAVGPRIVAAGRIVDGPKPVWPGSIAAKDAEEGRKAVQTVKQEGSDFVKVYSRLPRDAYFAIADEAKRQGMVFAGHVPDSITAAEASDAGQKSIEHLTGVLEACSRDEAVLRHPDLTLSERDRDTAETKALTEGYDEMKARALFARFKRNHTWHCPTLVVAHNIAYLNTPELSADPRIRFMPALATTSWDPKKDFRFKDMTPDGWENERRLYRKKVETVGKMNRAGVAMLAGTDTLNPYCFPGFSLHDELAYLVEAGLTPLQALQTATINPARYFGREKELGTIEAGKLADLVLLGADPLRDIHNMTNIRAVMANGRLFDRAALDKMLSEAQANGQPAPGAGTPKTGAATGR